MIPRFDEKRGGVRGWVLGITRNAVIDHFRAQRMPGDPDAVERLADAALDPAQALEDDQRDDALRALWRPSAGASSTPRKSLAI